MDSDVAALLRRLIATDSVNPSLVPGGAGEVQIAAVIADWARAEGLEVQLLEAEAGRPSVVVRARGTGGGKTLLLCGHIDTVTVDGVEDPFVPRLAGDELHGRGGYDMKGGVAAALVACRDAARLGLAGDVVVAAVADEEHASLGVQEALRSITADAAIVTEPTELALAIAHKGFVWSQVLVQGHAAHGSRPHLGVDAIVHAGTVLQALGELDDELAARPRHELLGRASIHASTIEGGEELSSYPARCTIGIERRTLPGERLEDVEAELAALLGRCRATRPGLQVTASTLLVREPFEIAADHPLVATVAQAAASALGAPPEVVGVSFWADSSFIAAAGIPTVLLGPAGAGAHEAVEWVSLDSVERLTGALLAVARRICGTPA